MASWLILGGVLPLGAALVIRHQQGYNAELIGCVMITIILAINGKAPT